MPLKTPSTNVGIAGLCLRFGIAVGGRKWGNFLLHSFRDTLGRSEGEVVMGVLGGGLKWSIENEYAESNCEKENHSGESRLKEVGYWERGRVILLPNWSYDPFSLLSDYYSLRLSSTVALVDIPAPNSTTYLPFRCSLSSGKSSSRRPLSHERQQFKYECFRRCEGLGYLVSKCFTDSGGFPEVELIGSLVSFPVVKEA